MLGIKRTPSLNTSTLRTGAALGALVTWPALAPAAPSSVAPAAQPSALASATVHEVGERPPPLGEHCTLYYTDGTLEVVDRDYCDGPSECATDEELQSCRAADHVCVLVERCDCNYVEASYSADREYEDDVHLTGVPDLWQFDHGCVFDVNDPPNAVGCAPVAAAALMYWWAQQGYDHLVEDFTIATSWAQNGVLHDWQALVRTLRDEYLSGVCLPFSDGWFFGYTPFSGGQFAVLPGTLEQGLRQYLGDAGYDARVRHVKVCDDCERNGSDELSREQGLDLIRAELLAGRPLIMGFNVGKAEELLLPLGKDGQPVVDAWGDVALAYRGPLSGGAAFIDHYALVTGYLRADGGEDMLTINMGWSAQTSVDRHVLWNPKGKWVHLYTLELTSRAGGAEWCSLDHGVSQTFARNDDVYLSHADETPHDALAGQRCGIVRDSTITTTVTTRDPGYTCRTQSYFFDEELVPTDREGDIRFDALNNEPDSEAQDESVDGNDPFLEPAAGEVGR